MYTNLEVFCIIICATFVIGSYIYLKASGHMWYGINWKAVWNYIKKLFK